MTIPPPLFPAPSDRDTESPDAAAENAAPVSWWRRNRLALIVLVAVAPLTAAGILWHEWHQFYGYDARPFIPVAVAEGDTAELAGATWGPVRSAEVDDTGGFDVPAGAKLLAVAVPVEPGDDGIGCRAPRLVEQATGREWESASLEIGLLPTADEPEYCSTLDTAPYELIVPFVVPDDVEGPFWVDVWPQSAGGSFLRFPVDP